MVTTYLRAFSIPKTKISSMVFTTKTAPLILGMVMTQSLVLTTLQMHLPPVVSLAFIVWAQ